jgi:hypothetical protein
MRAAGGGAHQENGREGAGNETEVPFLGNLRESTPARNVLWNEPLSDLHTKEPIEKTPTKKGTDSLRSILVQPRSVFRLSPKKRTEQKKQLVYRFGRRWELKVYIGIVPCSVQLRFSSEFTSNTHTTTIPSWSV